MLLVAVSGGIDSMCLAQKVRLEGGPFAIAHCNFGLRGADSDGDEAFVRSWAAACCVPCHVKRFDTKAFASAQGISVEMAARRMRYHWFGQLCREFGYSAVAVAHNANDNAETLILNLLRGTGIKGLLGMKSEGFLPDPDFADIPLLRPLLGMTRAQIEDFSREQGLSWREDVTNAQNDYKRNKIRNLVFPVFREINPSFVQTLNRDMARLAEELSGARWSPNGPGLILEGRPSPHNMPQNNVKAINHGLGPAPKKRPSPKVSVQEELWDGTQPVKQPAGVLILDADKLEDCLRSALLRDGAEALGRWESGDWIRPLGAPGKKKMQDWFTDHHIPADEKPFIPLLKSAADPHHVLAVVPFCIDHSVRVTKSTRHILRISVKND